MKNSTAYNITKYIQRFLATALEIKTKYIDTKAYTKTNHILDLGPNEKPSLRALSTMLTRMCMEDDANFHMGTPVLDKHTMQAYAEHVIDNSDIVASRKIRSEQLSILDTVIEFFQSEIPNREDCYIDPVPELVIVSNALKYIKEWEEDYCQLLCEEYDIEKDSPHEIEEDDFIRQRKSLPLTKVDIESINGRLHRFAYEIDKLRSLHFGNEVIYESASAAGVDFAKVNLYDVKQTKEFYNKVYDYSKREEGPRSRFCILGRTYCEGLPVRKEKRLIHKEWPICEDIQKEVILFFYEAFICKWATLYVDLQRLYDYAISNEDTDILKDMKELMDDANPYNLILRYRRERKMDGTFKESIWKPLNEFAHNISSLDAQIDRYFLRTEQGIVGDDEISRSRFFGLILDYGQELSSEGNKAHWTEKTVERFMKLGLDDFIFVLRADFDTFKRYGLKKFYAPSLQDIYDYLEIHSGSFNKDKTQLLLSQLEAANKSQYEAIVNHVIKQHSFVDEDEETGETRIEYYDSLPLDEMGKPIPDKCFEMIYGERKEEDEFRYNYAISILCEKLGYQKDDSQEPFEIDNIKIYKYKKEVAAKKRTLTAAEASDTMDRIHRQSDMIGGYYNRIYGRWPSCAPEKYTKADMLSMNNYKTQMDCIRLTEQDYDNLFEYIKENVDLCSAYSLYNWNWLVHKRLPYLLDNLYKHNKKDTTRILDTRTGKYELFFPEIELYDNFRFKLHSWLQDMEGKYCSWDKTKTENFYALGAEEFTIIILGWQEKANNNGNLFLYKNLEQSTVYNYIYNKTIGFQPEACKILLQSILTAKEKHLQFLRYAASLYYTRPEISYNCIYSDEPEEYFDFAPLHEDGSLNKDKCLIDCFGICNDSYLFTYATELLGSNIGQAKVANIAPDSCDSSPKTPIDYLFQATVQEHKRKAIYKHLLENKDIKSANNYIGAIAEALRNNKMIVSRYYDFSTLVRSLGEAVGIPANKMDIRVTRIGQRHKDTANEFVKNVKSSREPRK